MGYEGCFCRLFSFVCLRSIFLLYSWRMVFRETSELCLEVWQKVLSADPLKPLFVYRLFIRSETCKIWGCVSNWMQWSVLRRSACCMWSELPDFHTVYLRYHGFFSVWTKFMSCRGTILYLWFWNLSMEIICRVSEIVLASSGYLNMELVSCIFFCF
jgi:hypothetical protein